MSAAAPAPVAVRPTILVAEDEDGIRTTVAAILRMKGFDVIEAVDGEEALLRLDEATVAVMILDVRMPRRDGVSVLDALDKPPAVVLVSAHSLDAESHHRLEHKIFAVLKKPFHPERLLDMVEAALAGGDR